MRRTIQEMIPFAIAEDEVEKRKDREAEADMAKRFKEMEVRQLQDACERFFTAAVPVSEVKYIDGMPTAMVDGIRFVHLGAGKGGNTTLWLMRECPGCGRHVVSPPISLGPTPLHHYLTIDKYLRDESGVEWHTFDDWDSPHECAVHEFALINREGIVHKDPLTLERVTFDVPAITTAMTAALEYLGYSVRLVPKVKVRQ